MRKSLRTLATLLLTLAAAFPLSAWEEYIVELDPEASWHHYETGAGAGSQGATVGWLHVVVDRDQDTLWIPTTYVSAAEVPENLGGGFLRGSPGALYGNNPWPWSVDFAVLPGFADRDRLPREAATGYFDPIIGFHLSFYSRFGESVRTRWSFRGKVAEGFLRIKDVFPTAAWDTTVRLKFDNFVDPVRGGLHRLDVLWFPTVESTIHGYWGYVQPGPKETQFWAWDTMLDAWLLVDTANSSWLWSSRHGWLEFVDYETGEFAVVTNRVFIRVDDGTELSAPTNTRGNGIDWNSFVYPEQHPMRP